MLDRGVRLAILIFLLTWQAAAPGQANDGSFEGRQPIGGLHQPWQPLEPAAVTGGGVLQAGLADSPPAASWQRPVRLPPTLPRLSSAAPLGGLGPAPGQLADGTWREDGRYIIINLNGQQVRLVNESQTPGAPGVPHRAEATGGTVYGRLLNHGRPLASCQVIIRPMTKTFAGYTFNPAVQPIRTTTDVQGVYRFENVPPGPYKLSWLPLGTNQWIRRIAVRPDLTVPPAARDAVRTQEMTQVKDIPVALRTIN